MDKHIYDLALALRQSIENHPDVILLNTYEEVMNQNRDIQALADQYASLQSNLNDLLTRFEVEHPEVKKVRADLSFVKYQLDSHPDVKSYQNQFKIVNKIYNKINKSLFQDFCQIKDCKCL